MIAAEDFEEMVHSALSHLYDHSYLLQHPLACLLDDDPRADYRANRLRRILLDAIQDLKPPREVPTDSPAWRYYQYLYLRYVEARPVANIARDLAVTDRQTRRRHRDALAALSRILRERLSDRPVVAEPMKIADGRTDRLPRAITTASSGSILDTELERMRSSSDEGFSDVAEVVAGALLTVAPLARSRGVVTSIAAIERTRVAADPIVLREALLETLAYVIEQGTGASLIISWVSNAETLKLGIRISPVIGPGVPDRSAQPFQLAEVERLLRASHGSISFSDEHKQLAIDIQLPLARLRSILVIDDNPDMLQLFRRYLRATSYSAVLAQSGDDALRLARESRPACIILDVMMPRRDGWEVLQTLRADATTREIPILVCTVLQQTELARSLGADGFLAKPITRRSLLAAIDRCCQRSG